MKLKYFAAGSIAGVAAQIYLISFVEQRTKLRKNELNRLKLLYQKDLVEKIKLTSDQTKDKDIIFSILFHSYLNYLASASLIFIKFLTSNDKQEKIQAYFREVLKGEMNKNI